MISSNIISLLANNDETQQVKPITREFNLNADKKRFWLGRIEHIDTIEKDGRLYYSYKVLRTKKLASAIIQNSIDDIGRIKEETREVNLNGDDKRFWLGRLVNINDKKSNESTSLNPEFFAERFELNDDFKL